MAAPLVNEGLRQALAQAREVITAVEDAELVRAPSSVEAALREVNLLKAKLEACKTLLETGYEA